jgi:hypothetical protein
MDLVHLERARLLATEREEWFKRWGEAAQTLLFCKKVNPDLFSQVIGEYWNKLYPEDHDAVEAEFWNILERACIIYESSDRTRAIYLMLPNFLQEIRVRIGEAHLAQEVS